MMKLYNKVLKGANAVVIATGQKHLLALPFPDECTIGKVVVKQSSTSGGTAVPFSVEVLNSKVGLTAGDFNSALPEEVPLHRVLPLASQPAGGVVEHYVGSNGYMFANYDQASPLALQELYIIISPESAGGETRWDIAVTAGVYQ